MSEKKSIFSTLSEISVKEKIERKGNLDYLSWANAWAMLKAVYPDAQRKVYEHDHTGFNYFTDGRSAYVKVGIIVNGLEHIDYLPVMDFRNNAIPIEKVSAMDVNKTIQRSTAKAIAMHGLGLSLWTGEDVPEQTTDKPSHPVSSKTPKKAAAAEESDLPELQKDTEAWEKVSSYVISNASLGVEKLGKQITRKYKLSPAIKKEIANMIKSADNGSDTTATAE
jgi:hypothetical protein